MRLKLENLTRAFHDAERTLTVLENVSFEFPSECTISIVGRSGVGKSTLLHILGGLENPSAGRIFMDGVDVTAMRDSERAAFRGANLGFIFQFHHLLPEFTALENVAMPLFIQGIQDAQAESQARELLETVGLSHRLTHRPGELSGGEQQRVAIARALVARPRLVLADEPTGNLDINTSREVQELLVRVQREFKTTMIVVTHDQVLAASMDVQLEMLPGGMLRGCGG